MLSLKSLSDEISSIQASAEELAGIKGYEHVQTPASATWTITHNLDTYNVDVVVVDAVGEVILPNSIILVSANQITVGFAGNDVEGTARIVAKM